MIPAGPAQWKCVEGLEDLLGGAGVQNVRPLSYLCRLPAQDRQVTGHIIPPSAATRWYCLPSAGLQWARILNAVHMKFLQIKSSVPSALIVPLRNPPLGLPVWVKSMRAVDRQSQSSSVPFSWQIFNWQQFWLQRELHAVLGGPRMIWYFIKSSQPNNECGLISALHVKKSRFNETSSPKIWYVADLVSESILPSSTGHTLSISSVSKGRPPASSWHLSVSLQPFPLYLYIKSSLPRAYTQKI